MKKRINTSAKGARLELKAKQILEDAGYLVHRCVRTPVKRGKLFFSNSNDIFNAFDLVAIRRDATPRFIQVTIREDRRARMRKVNQIVGTYAGPSMRIEVWADLGDWFDVWSYDWRRNLWECGTKTYDARKPLPVRGAA